MSRVKRTVKRSKEGLRAVCLKLPWPLYHRVVDSQKRLRITQTALIRRAIARYLKELESAKTTL